MVSGLFFCFGEEPMAFQKWHFARWSVGLPPHQQRTASNNNVSACAWVCLYHKALWMNECWKSLSQECERVFACVQPKFVLLLFVWLDVSPVLLLLLILLHTTCCCCRMRLPVYVCTYLPFFQGKMSNTFCVVCHLCWFKCKTWSFSFGFNFKCWCLLLFCFSFVSFVANVIPYHLA